MKKEDIKEFWKKHGNFTVFTAACMFAACGVWYLSGRSNGYDKCIKEYFGNEDSAKKFKRMLNDAAEYYGTNELGTFIGWTSDAVPPSELGRLGEVMKDVCKLNDETKFSHFFAIGEVKDF